MQSWVYSIFPKVSLLVTFDALKVEMLEGGEVAWPIVGALVPVCHRVHTLAPTITYPPHIALVVHAGHGAQRGAMETTSGAPRHPIVVLQNVDDLIRLARDSDCVSIATADCFQLWCWKRAEICFSVLIHHYIHLWSAKPTKYCYPSNSGGHTLSWGKMYLRSTLIIFIF